MKYPKPFGEKILVKRDKVENTGKLLFSTNVPKNEGIIVEVGCDTKEKPMRVEIGQHIMFSGYGLTKVPIDEDKENEYILMNQSDILAILN